MSRTTTRLAPLFAVLLGVLGCGPAWAAGYPEKPLTLVVPFPPGGATDTIARVVAKGMGQRLAQTVIVDNKAGAGTTIGAGAVAQAAPDGYTLLISSNTTFTVNPALKAKLPYDAQKSFESIGLIGTSPLVLLANPSLPARSIGRAATLVSKLRATWPPIRSVIAGELPLYGTCRMSTPVASLNTSPARCEVVPLPNDA